MAGRRRGRSPIETACKWLVMITVESVDSYVSAGLQGWDGKEAVIDALLRTGQLTKISELAPPGQGAKLLVAWTEVSEHPAAPAIGRELDEMREWQETEARAWLRRQLDSLDGQPAS